CTPRGATLALHDALPTSRSPPPLLPASPLRSTARPPREPPPRRTAHPPPEHPPRHTAHPPWQPPPRRTAHPPWQPPPRRTAHPRSEEHTSELQSRENLVC